MTKIYYIGENSYKAALDETGYEIIPATWRDIVTPHELVLAEPGNIALTLTSAHYDAIVIQYLGDSTLEYLQSLNGMKNWSPLKTVPPVAIIVPPNDAARINQKAFENLKIHFVHDSVIPIQLEEIIESSTNK